MCISGNGLGQPAAPHGMRQGRADQADADQRDFPNGFESTVIAGS